MTDGYTQTVLDELRREFVDKSHQLTQLDLILADYHAERVRLIRDLRRLQVRLRDAEERLQAYPNRALDQQFTRRTL